MVKMTEQPDARAVAVRFEPNRQAFAIRLSNGVEMNVPLHVIPDFAPLAPRFLRQVVLAYDGRHLICPAATDLAFDLTVLQSWQAAFSREIDTLMRQTRDAAERS